LIDKNGINKIAKEITGVDEVVKDLRANNHEFKNKLHVILGLININQYDEARKYIMQIQQVQESNFQKYSYIDDFYIRAMIISRELMAKEKNIRFTIAEGSSLYEEHDPIEHDDLVTILGNLIENAFEACVSNNNENKNVEVYLMEDHNSIHIEVTDNGVSIPENMKEKIFQRGVSSKPNNSGIGLYLVKTKADLYEGNIKLREFENKKKFIITLFKEEN
jgi:two-component system CitB family sensor kinase